MTLPDKSQLSEKQLMILQTEMALRRKSALIAYLIFFLPPGPFGGHHWYLGHVFRSIFYFFCGVVWVVGLFVLANSRSMQSKVTASAAAVAGLAVYGLVLAFDAVTLAWQVSRTNRRIERQVIASLIRAAEAPEADEPRALAR